MRSDLRFVPANQRLGLCSVITDGRDSAFTGSWLQIAQTRANSEDLGCKTIFSLIAAFVVRFVARWKCGVHNPHRNEEDQSHAVSLIAAAVSSLMSGTRLWVNVQRRMRGHLRSERHRRVRTRRVGVLHRDAEDEPSAPCCGEGNTNMCMGPTGTRAGSHGSASAGERCGRHRRERSCHNPPAIRLLRVLRNAPLS